MLEGSILQQLRDAHNPDQTGKRALNFGVYYKNTLVALCHALEDAILTNRYSPLVLTAFQRGKWYLQEADRYRDIAENSQHVVILACPDAGFAEHPTSQLNKVDLVSLDTDDAVSQEWHLVIISPHYTAMVLCQELSEAEYGKVGLPQHDLERKFYGLWTFEPSLVQETAELLIEHVGQYNPELQRSLQSQLNEIAPQLQQADALCGLPTADNLGDIVSRVVDYLETSQQGIGQDFSFYQPQQIDSNLLSNELQAFLRVAQLIDQTDLSNPMAAAEVASLAEGMGQLLDLPAWQLHRLRLSGLLHRIAFLQAQDTVLSSRPSAQSYAESPDVAPSCPLVPGIQVLRRMQRLRAVAIILTHQTEWWDGSGSPAGLSGDDIPIESRILGLVSHFQQQVARLRSAQSQIDPTEALSQALADCRNQQSSRWDPKLIEVLELLVSALQQGFSLPVALPKIVAGLWLLDSHADEDLLQYSQASERSLTS